MGYSLAAFKKGYGKPWLFMTRFSLAYGILAVLCLVIPTVFLGKGSIVGPIGDFIINVIIMPGMLLLVVGAWFFYCMYLGAKQKAKRQKLVLHDGKLHVHAVLANGWTGDVLGRSEIDIHDYLFERITSYKETMKYIIVTGTMQITKTDNWRAVTEEVVSSVRVGKCFDDLNDFKAYLDKAIELGGSSNG